MHKQEIRELLCAMLLGDGSFSQSWPKNRKCRQVTFAFSHSTKQQDYAQWKQAQINSIFEQKNLERRAKAHFYEATTGNPKYPRRYPVIKVKLCWNQYFDKIFYERAYRDGKKNYEYLLSQVYSPKHLFIWAADDGCEIRPKKKHKSGEVYIGRPKLRFYTNDMTSGQINLTKEWFKYHWKVVPMVHHSGVTNGKKPILNFSPHDSEFLFQKFSVYAKQLKSMKFKFRRHLELYG